MGAPGRPFRHVNLMSWPVKSVWSSSSMLSVIVTVPRLATLAGATALALSTFTLTACGGSDPASDPPAVQAEPTAAPTDTPAAVPATSAASGLPDLCTKLTAGQVADAAGVDIPLVRPEPGPNIISCAYHLRNDEASPAIFVQYQLDAAGIMDFTNSGEVLAGIGERAKWYERGAKLNVQVNGTDLLIVNLGVSNKNLRGGDLRALAVELAERALPLVRR